MQPAISFAMHQCAQYSSNPTALHELAVKHIGSYFLATKGKGMILHPTNTFKSDMFVDADYAGMWHREYSELCDCALSISGYIITYCGCPIHWTPKLQSEIDLSTTEAKYIALSMASHELLPLWFANSTSIAFSLCHWIKFLKFHTVLSLLQQPSMKIMFILANSTGTKV